MPRMPRSHTVVENYQVMKTWRGHNKEWNIHNKEDRLTYLKYLKKKYKKQQNILNAIVLMANHTHEIYTIKDQQSFSSMMREHHSLYGRYFNRKNNRCGKVAQDRPHTSQIETDNQALTVTFYLLANPLRAGVVKDPRNYRFSSYKYYAFGIKDEFIDFLSYPDWYLNLGRTPEVRQRNFRRLFFQFLRLKGLVKENYSKEHFIGSILWVNNRKLEVKKALSSSNSSPP